MLKGLDLSKFKKVDANRDHTVFQSEDGHLVYVSNKSIPKDLHDSLRKLPVQKMSKGGVVRRPAGHDLPSEKERKKFQDTFNAALGAGKVKKMAEGGAAGEDGEDLTELETEELRARFRQAVPPDPGAPLDPDVAALRAKTDIIRDEQGNIISAGGVPAEELRAAGTLRGNELVIPQDIGSMRPGLGDLSSMVGKAGSAIRDSVVSSRTGTRPAAVEGVQVSAVEEPTNYSLPLSEDVGAGGQVTAPLTELDTPMADAMANFGKGVEQEANIAAQVAQGELAALKQQERDQQQYQKDLADNFKQQVELTQQYQKDLEDPSYAVDQNRLTGSLDFWGRIQLGLGLALGGASAKDYLNKLIERDIEEQKRQLGKKDTLYSRNLEMIKDQQAASDKSYLMQQQQVANKLQQLAAKHKGPQAQANALKLTAEFSKSMGELMAKEAERSTQLQQRQQMLGARGGTQTLTQARELILATVPQHLHKQAFDELASASSNPVTLDSVNKLYKRMEGIGGLGGNIPFTEDKAAAEGIQTAILVNVIKSLGANPSDRDMKVVEKLIPSATDRVAQVKVKAKLMREYLINQQKAKSPTTTLESFGINVQKPVSARTGPAPKMMTKK